MIEPSTEKLLDYAEYQPEGEGSNPDSINSAEPVEDADDESELIKTRRTFSKFLIILSLAFLITIVAIILQPDLKPKEKEDPRDFGPCLVPFRVFDTHVQAFSVDNPVSSRIELNRILRQFWRSNVWGGVIVQQHGSDDTAFLNELAAAQGKLRGVISFRREYDRGSLSDFHEKGVRGARFDIAAMTTAERATFYSAVENGEYEYLFQFVRDRRWHLVVTEIGNGWSELLPLLTATGCRIVVDHFGLPQSVDDPAIGTIYQAIKDYPLMWLKTTPYIATYLQENEVRVIVSDVIKNVPETRLIWGSYYMPDIEGDAAYDTDRRSFVSWFEKVELRFRILSRNPAELYAFDDTQKFWDV